ncbi:hypothetical protein MSG28_006603 [Choristoneura fumiferana]|uniref:Uncharacterized protein n=1 Tax=Choristoneura fumiferana TaxID=7141 RepID=A0ACC0JFI8_CHOFU|nr:hypothetical protein MSG28_006603 [Choristoneura fumiferana]
MSTNAVNVEDAEMTECDDEKVVTMMDVLQEQQEFEEDANAVLGASDDKNCTYSKEFSDPSPGGEPLHPRIDNDAMLDRKYFYTTDFKFWGLLPRAKRRYKLLSLLTTFPFRGDPTLKIKILDEALEENHPDRCQVIKEESRLAGTISNICDEAEICARGQLIKQPDGTVVINPNFYGLTGSEAKQLKSYLHIRPSQQRWNSNLLSRQDYNYSMDFLDSIDQDIPSGCWNLSLEQGGSVAYLKSLYWPGMTYFHKARTPDCGFLYVGNGRKNLDVPFLL